MNILFIVPYVPNPIRVRSYNLIRELARRGNQLTVTTLWTEESERRDVRRLEEMVERVHAAHLSPIRSALNSISALPSTDPLQATYCWQPDLARQIRSLVQDGHHFDVIHVEHLRGAKYGLELGQHAPPRIPVLWDSVDCISLLFQQAAQQTRRRISRWLTRFELGRTRRFEGWLSGQFDHITVTSAEDKSALLKLNGQGSNGAPISVLPNGVDLDYFTPGAVAEREPATLVLTGKMSYHANVTMALHMIDQILPLLWKRRPETKLWIVGKDPPPSVRSADRDPRITVTGMIPDMRTYLCKATVAVAPLTYGVGIQNKVLEAMACGVPVVSTSQGISALGAKPDREVVLGDGPAAFADAVLALLNDPHKRTALAEAGRRYVEQHHQWSIISAQLEGIYRELISVQN